MSHNSTSEKTMLTFIWRIENFSSTCIQISSPEFEAKALDDTVWSLVFSPDISSYSSLGHGYIKCRSIATGSEAINVNTLISCSSENGEFLPFQQIDDHDFKKFPATHFSLDKLEPVGRSAFLPNDTLTIQCQLWQNGRESSQAVQFSARSRLGTTRIVRVWKVDFSKSQQTILLHSGNEFDPCLQLWGFRAKSSGYFHIKIDTNKQHFVRGKTSVLEDDGKTGKFSQSIHWNLESKCANHYTNFIPKSFGRFETLDLLCNFVIFNGKDFNAIEEVNCIPLMYPNIRVSRMGICGAATLDDTRTWCRCFCDRGTQTCEVQEDANLSPKSNLTSEAVESSEQQLPSLQEDMLDLYTRKQFCDLTLRTGDKTFPVHTAVLCARSQKFRAMLMDSQTKEGDRSNEKEIDAKMEVKNGAYVLGEKETKKVHHTSEKIPINAEIPKSNKMNELDVEKDAKYISRVDKNAMECSDLQKSNPSEMHEKERDFLYSENNFKSTENTEIDFDSDKSENEYVVETKETLKPFSCRENKSFLEMTIQKEKTDFLDILDMDSDTLSLLLNFMYSDTVEDLQADRASHLYLASTKYGVLPLQAKCLSIVESTLSMSNVCEVLMLSDDFKGYEIRKMAEDFFCGHTKDILVSDAWKIIMENRPQLASQLMFKAFLQKN